MRIGIEAVFGYMALKPEVVWKYFQAPIALCFDPSDEVDAGVQKRMQEIEGNQESHFGFDLMGLRFEYGHIGNCDLSFLSVEGNAEFLQHSYQWVEPFLSHESFVHARVYDLEFEFWQNARDPLEYEVKGRSYKHLPMKSNQLPFPLEKMVIDTSQNPGRRIPKHGYIEAIGSLMWFGDSFWELAGSTKDVVRGQDWLYCRSLPPRVLQVQVDEKLFITAEGEQRQVQERLRNLLFPRLGKST